ERWRHAFHQPPRQPGILAVVLMAAEPSLYRYAVRHQGPAQNVLGRHSRRSILFRGRGSVRRFRPDPRCLAPSSQDGRNSLALRRPRVRRNADFAFLTRLVSTAHGGRRLSPTQGVLMTPLTLRRLRVAAMALAVAACASIIALYHGLHRPFIAAA